MTVTAPGPYEAKISRADTPAGGYRSAEQELADALEGQAPRLAHDVAGLLGPARTAQLAQVIHRAVAVGIKRRAAQETAVLVSGAYDLLVQGLDQVTDGCTTPEIEGEQEIEICWAPYGRGWLCPLPKPCPKHPEVEQPCDHSESLHGRCVACGMTWEQQEEARRG